MKTRAQTMRELSEIMSSTFDAGLTATSVQDFSPRSTDIIITPFGKCGTTWTQQIFHTLRTRGDMAFDDISRVVPWIETSGLLGLDINAEQVTSPRGFKSHLSFDRIPKGCKYINVIRNPLDAAFSSFKFMEGWYLEFGAVSADVFVTQNLKRGDYYRHFISWWPQRNNDRVLYLVYEDMKENLNGNIKKISKFAEIDLDDDLLAITEKQSSYLFMTDFKDRFDDAMLRKQSEENVLPPGSDSSKVRAGEVGAYEFKNETIAAFNDKWREIVTPVTGFGTYEDLAGSWLR